MKFDPRPHYPKTRELMITKICMGDYVPDVYCDKNLHYDQIKEFYPPPTYAKLPTKCLLGYFFGFLKLAIPKAAAPILTRSTSKDVVSRKDESLGPFSTDKISARFINKRPNNTSTYAFGSWMLNRLIERYKLKCY